MSKIEIKNPEALAGKTRRRRPESVEPHDLPADSAQSTTDGQSRL